MLDGIGGISANYEHKFVAYFDILGWRSKIIRAGSDASQLGILRTVVELFSIFGSNLDVKNNERIITSFSDNVVCSFPFNESEIQELIESLARIQLGVACMGFFVRGAVTIGDIYHTKSAVFGPALIRAYELESIEAKFPRIILDPLIPELEKGFPYTCGDDDYRIINPFNKLCAEKICKMSVSDEGISDFFERMGVDNPAIRDIPVHQDGGIILNAVLILACREYELAGGEKERQKIKWIIDLVSWSLHKKHLEDSDIIYISKVYK